MIRQKLQQFMIGRCGADQLSLATMWTAIIFWLIHALSGWMLFYILSVVAMFFTFFRMFSRRLDKRRAENARFLALIRPAQRKVSTTITHMKDKEHRYFRCPNCKQQMRAPRGKGRIRVTCRNCGVTFDEKS